MKVLCVNHTGAISGAERSLLDLVHGLPDDVRVRVACPPDSPLAAAAEGLGVPVDPIPGTDGSLKLHPRETPVAVAQLAVAAAQTARHARRMGADVIHANSIRSGLLAVPASRMSRTPVVVHLRDRLPRSAVADASMRLIATGADIAAANSRYTADGMRAVTDRGRLRVIHNPVDLDRFDPAHTDRAAARSRLGLPADAFVLAIIGQITPWKGQHEAVQTLAALKAGDTEAHLLVVGEAKFVSAATRYDNNAYHAELVALIGAHGLGDRVHLLGERGDVPEILSAIDVLLVPSWEEPFGRVVVEAMAQGVVVVATNVGGPAEIVQDGVDGALLAPRDPAAWADALARLAGSPRKRATLGRAAARRAQDFALPRHVSAMQDIYAEAIEVGGARSRFKAHGDA